MLPEIPLKHEMKLLKFEHNKLKNTQVDDKTYYKYIGGYDELKHIMSFKKNSFI